MFFAVVVMLEVTMVTVAVAIISLVTLAPFVLALSIDLFPPPMAIYPPRPTTYGFDLYSIPVPGLNHHQISGSPQPPPSSSSS